MRVNQLESCPACPACPAILSAEAGPLLTGERRWKLTLIWRVGDGGSNVEGPVFLADLPAVLVAGWRVSSFV